MFAIMEMLDTLRGMDIYLIDQILKGRYLQGEHILDAGAGSGRNMSWFLDGKFQVFAFDPDLERRAQCQSRFPNEDFEWLTCSIENMPFSPQKFNHIICCAVLHFATNHEHFNLLFNKLAATLKPGGSFFIRTCIEGGMRNEMTALGNGRFLLPDESERYVLSEKTLEDAVKRNNLSFAEPIKGTHVLNQRVMGTLLLQRNTK